jgi:hypothetical protein
MSVYYVIESAICTLVLVEMAVFQGRSEHLTAVL